MPCHSLLSFWKGTWQLSPNPLYVPLIVAFTSAQTFIYQYVKSTKMKRFLIFAIPLFIACNAGEESKTDAADVAPQTEAQDSLVVLPSSSTDNARKAVEGYVAGNMDAFRENMSEDIRLYHPAAGDSLLGLQAVVDYYSKRRSEAESIQLLDPIFLGVRNNVGLNVMPGDWIMSWYRFQIKYKSGKSVELPIHTVQHLNASGKTDMMAMYYDLHRVMEASK